MWSRATAVTPNGERIALADAQPVRDPRVVRVERDEDHVHVQERRDRGHDVGDPPARREGEQDRRQAEEREQVPLVDARRDGEEGQGEHADADEDRQPVRPARDAPHATTRPQSSAAPTSAAGIGPIAPQAAASGTGESASSPPAVATLWPSTGNSAHQL